MVNFPELAQQIRVNKRQNLNCAYYTAHFSKDYISAQYIPQFDISAQYIPQFDNQYPRIWILGDQQQFALLVYPTFWQAISQNMNFRKSAAISLRIWKYNTNLITMGQEVSKVVKIMRENR